MDARLAARDYDPLRDRSYLAKSFLAGLRVAPGFANSADRLHNLGGQKLFDRIMDSRWARVMVICDREDPQFIAAWLLAWRTPRVTILWWVHVRDIWRRQGIAKELLDCIAKNGGTVAHVFDRRLGKDSARKRLAGPRKFTYWPMMIVEAFSGDFE